MRKSAPIINGDKELAVGGWEAHRSVAATQWGRWLDWTRRSGWMGRDAVFCSDATSGFAAKTDNSAVGRAWLVA